MFAHFYLIHKLPGRENLCLLVSIFDDTSLKFRPISVQFLTLPTKCSLSMTTVYYILLLVVFHSLMAIIIIKRLDHMEV